MALLFVDGFDYYASGDILTRWTIGSAPIGSGGARNGLNGLSDPTGLGKTIPSTGNIFLAGFAVRIGTFFANQTLIAVGDGSFLSPQITIRVNADNTLSACVGDALGTELARTTWTATANTWYSMEVKVGLHQKLGSVEVVVNGSLFNLTVLSVQGTNAAPIDTQPSGSPQWDTIYLDNADADYDDLFICDGSGPYNNNFLGDCIVDALIAQSDAGSEGPGFNVGLTPSTGTNHGVLVGNLTPNGDTDYNAGTDVGVKDTYQLPLVTSAGGILGVQVDMYVKKLAPVTKTVCAVIRTHGADFAGSLPLLEGPKTFNPSVSYGYLSDVFETDPYTGVPWIGAEMKDLQAGLQVMA